MADEEDVRRLCLAFPGVTERMSWSRPAWFAKKLMARMWEDDVVTLKTEEREALVRTAPETFFWTAHHEQSPGLVLVRLRQVGDEELAELVADSHRLASR